MEDKELRIREYRICFESLQHHERMMWQLVWIHLAVTGAVMSIAVTRLASAVAPEASGFPFLASLLLLTVPILTGVFASLALWKHKHFWTLDLNRMKELENELGMKRESEWAVDYAESWKGIIKTWDAALMVVLLPAVVLWVAIFVLLLNAKSILGVSLPVEYGFGVLWTGFWIAVPILIISWRAYLRKSLSASASEGQQA